MMEADNTRYPIRPAKLVTILSDGGYSPTQVSQMLGGRISFRALYRWRNEEAMPQRYADYVDVLQLATGLGLLGALPEQAETEEQPVFPALAPEPDVDDADTASAETDPYALDVDGDSDGEE
jgi:hypothetical protein